MAHTLFISDIHLQEETPKITSIFLQFLQQQAPNADALYILGDCFETWIGDDDCSSFNQQISQALRILASQGTPIYVMHGNRDFLLGSRFAQQSSVQLLPDPTVIQLYGQTILLSHGDRLCTLDIKHQAYRNKANRRWVQKLFLCLPLLLRQTIAKRLRQKSRQHNLTVPAYITDVTPKEVQRLMKQYQVELLIHGHTHRPAIHEINIEGYLGKRIVLGPWHDSGNALIYHDDGSYALTLIE